jgi:hypothetical protein
MVIRVAWDHETVGSNPSIPIIAGVPRMAKGLVL